MLICIVYKLFTIFTRYDQIFSSFYVIKLSDLTFKLVNSFLLNFFISFISIMLAKSLKAFVESTIYISETIYEMKNCVKLHFKLPKL